MQIDLDTSGMPPPPEVSRDSGEAPETDDQFEPSYLREVLDVNQHLQGKRSWDPKELYAAIARQGESAVVDALLQEFSSLKSLLIDCKFPSPYEHAMAVWGIADSRAFQDPDEVDALTLRLKGRVFEIMLTCENYRLYNNAVFKERGITEVVMNSMLTLVHYLSNIVACAGHCQSLYAGKLDYTLKSETPLLRFGCTEGVYGSLRNSYQKLLYKMTWDLHETGRVRYKGAVRKKKYTPDGQFTHYYVHEMDLDEWVYKFGSQHADFERWKLLTDGRSNPRDACRHLTECHETLLFPEIKKTRTLFAFTNGLYDARELTFMPYESDACKELPESAVAAKYFELEFDDAPYASYLDIPTPSLDKILDAQDFSEGVRDWLLAFMGRSVFDGDDLDSWQVCMFLKGLGGSGKSTILKIMSAFYDAEDVGLIGNNIEGTFGLEGLIGCFMVLCLEMKSNFAMDQAVWQQAVSNELVSIARKNKVALKYQWKAHMGFASNENFPYNDNAGNLGRRLVAWYFSKVPKRPDQRLMKNIAKEMPNILRKCVEAYLDKVAKFAKVDLWGTVNGELVLPVEFHQLRTEMQSESNPLAGFIADDARWVKPGDHDDPKEFYVLASVFKEQYAAYCEQDGLVKQRWQPAVYRPVFTQYGCSYARNERRRWEGVLRHNEDWVVGLRINPDFQKAAFDQQQQQPGSAPMDTAAALN